MGEPYRKNVVTCLGLQRCMCYFSWGCTYIALILLGVSPRVLQHGNVVRGTLLRYDQPRSVEP